MALLPCECVKGLPIGEQLAAIYCATYTLAFGDVDGPYLLKAANLSDVADPDVSRTNVGAAESGANSDITSLLTIGAGIVGSPSITVGTATNGLYAPAANQIGIVADGAEKLLIKNAGEAVTVFAGTSTIKGLLIKNALGQSVNSFEVQNNAGNGIFYVLGDAGNIEFGFNTSPWVRNFSTGEVYLSMQAFSGAVSGVRIGDAAAYYYVRAAAAPTASVFQVQNSAGTMEAGFDAAFGLIQPKTITAAGTTGAQTINKPSGSVNFAAAATSLVVTNNLVSTNSRVLLNIATNDANNFSVRAVPAAGSFTIHIVGTAPAAETRVDFVVTN